jgi:hypothetical protein
MEGELLDAEDETGPSISVDLIIYGVDHPDGAR